jgi:hypothetical protein
MATSVEIWVELGDNATLHYGEEIPGGEIPASDDLIKQVDAKLASFAADAGEALQDGARIVLVEYHQKDENGYSPDGASDIQVLRYVNQPSVVRA